MSPNLSLRVDSANGMKKGKANTLNLALQTSLVQDNLPLEVVPHIYIGSIHAAFNQEAIAERGITHILNASGLPATFPRIFTYLTIDLRDKEASNILACIPAANIFIESALGHGSVLIHCAGGRSRSAAFITAYLMTSRGWSFDKAIATVRHARPIIQVNKGFEAQLRAYGAQHCDVYAAQQMIVRQRLHVYVDRRKQILMEKEYYRKALESGRPPSMKDLEATFVEEEGEEEEKDSGSNSTANINSSFKNLNLQDGRRVSGGHGADGGGVGSLDRRGSASSLRLDDPAVALPIQARGVCSTRSSMDGAIISERRGSASSLLGGLGSPTSKAVNTGLAPVAAVDALVETAEANFESFFGDSGRSLRRSQQPNSTRTPRGSHHRRGKTAGGTALPPIAPTDAPVTPNTTVASKMSCAFTDGPPATEVTHSVPLRSPFSSMSALSLEHNTSVTPSGGGRVTFQINSPALGSDDADREARESMVLNPTSNSNTPSRRISGTLQPPWNQGGPHAQDAASLLAARNRFCSAPALPHLTNMGLKPNKHELHPQVPPTPHLRLSKPATNTMQQVIPPLQGLERTFVCSACNTRLFSVGNIMRLDLTLAEADFNLDVLAAPAHHEGRNFDEDDDNASSRFNAPVPLGMGRSVGRRRTNESCRPTALEGLDSASYCTPTPGQQPSELISPLDSARKSSTSSSRPLDWLRSPTRAQDALAQGTDLSSGSTSSTTSTNRDSLSMSHPPTTPSHLDAVPPLNLTPSRGSSRKLFGFDNQLAATSLASPNSANGPPPTLKSKSGRLLSPSSFRDVDGQPRDNASTISLPEPTRTPTNASLINSIISPRTTFDSPRRSSVLTPDNTDVPLPERRPGSPSSSLFRPGSPERKRWVGKMKQLEDGAPGDRTIQALELDMDACGKVTAVEDRWIPIEYMPWMGDITFEDSGIFYCPNAHCKVEVGKWDWQIKIFPTSPLPMLAQLPLFGIDKNSVTLCNTRGHIGRQNSTDGGAPSGDSTPRATEGYTPRDSVTGTSISTPRLAVVPGTPRGMNNGGGGSSRRGSGGLSSPFPTNSSRQGSLTNGGGVAFSFGACK